MSTITKRVAVALRALGRSEPPTPTTTPAPTDPGVIEDLARRVDYLEAQLEGLQDAVYRQDVVHDRQIAELRATPPAAGLPPSAGEQL